MEKQTFDKAQELDKKIDFYNDFICLIDNFLKSNSKIGFTEIFKDKISDIVYRTDTEVWVKIMEILKYQKSILEQEFKKL